MPEDYEQESHFYPLKKDDPHYCAIGRIASAFSYFEFRINQLIWQLSTIDDERGACVTSHIYTFSARTKALLALIELIHDQTPEKIRDDAKAEGLDLMALRADLKKLFDKKGEPLSRKRNRVIHDTWMYGKKTGAIVQIRQTAERKLDYGFKPASIEDVDKWWQQIQQADQEFYRLAAHIQAVARELQQRAQNEQPTESHRGTRR